MTWIYISLQFLVVNKQLHMVGHWPCNIRKIKRGKKKKKKKEKSKQKERKKIPIKIGAVWERVGDPRVGQTDEEDSRLQIWDLHS